MNTTTNYRVSDILVAKIKEFEGCRLRAYRDSGGLLTIGVGHTKGVKAGQVITMSQAETLLRGDILPCEKYVNGLGVCSTQAQFDALVDFCFNLGQGSLQKSNLLQRVRCRGSENAIRAEFAKWIYCKGKKLPGLVRRRQWEADRFFEEGWL